MRGMLYELFLRMLLATAITTAVLIAIGTSLSGQSSKIECEYPHPKTFVNAKDMGCTLTKGEHYPFWYITTWVRYLKGRWEGKIEPQYNLRDATDTCEAWMAHVKHISHFKKGQNEKPPLEPSH